MVVLDGGQPKGARTFDISLGGISITTDYKLNPGQTGQVVFEMLVEGKPQLITVRGKVVHCIFSGDEFKVGLMFQPLAPEALAAITRFMK